MSRRPFSRRVAIALLVALGAGCGGQPEGPGPVDWASLAGEAEAAAAARERGRLAELAARVLAEPPPGGDLGFARLALACARDRLEHGDADAGELLLRGARALEGVHGSPAAGALATGYAEGLLAVELPRRAWEILGSPAGGSGDGEPLGSRLGATLAAFGADPRGLPDAAGADPRLRVRLIDLLTLPAVSAFYDPQEEVEAVAALPRPIPFARPPRLLSLLDAAPRPTALATTDSHLWLESVEISPLVLDGAQTAAVAAFARAGPSSPVADEASVVSAFGGGEEDRAWNVNGTVVLDLLRSDSPFLLVVVPNAATEAGTAWEAVVEAEDIGFRDVNGDGRPEIVALQRRGSGGFLDVVVLDLDAPRVLFSLFDLSRGEVIFLQLDDDPALEILVRTASEEGVAFCNQCPRRPVAHLFDHDAAGGVYRLAAIHHGAAEQVHGDYGPWGLGPHMWLRLFRRDGGTQAALRRLQALPSAARPAADLAALADAAHEESGLLQEAGLPGAAAELLAAAAELVEAKDQPPDLRRTGWALRLHQAAVLFDAGDVDGARRVLDPPGLADSLRGDEELRHGFVEIEGALGLARGELARAYEAIDLLRREVAEPHEAVEGNLALYLNMVGDHRAAYQAALGALDLAVRHGSGGAPLDMLHLAAATVRSDPETALEWLSRGLRLARGTSGASTLPYLSLAATLALDLDEPRLALALLDEAVALADEITWLHEGPTVLLLYAQALEAFVDGPEVDVVLRTAAGLAAESGHSAHAAAAHALSRRHERRGELASALAWARTAFAAAARGRRSIAIEEHKLSFLADKESIAGWRLRLEQRGGASPGTLLVAIEEWKAQVFLDIYGGPAPEAVARTVAALPARLAAGDLFVDYAVSGEVSIAVTVSPGGAVRLHRLPCSKDEVAAAADGVGVAFDLRDRHAVAAIRRDRLGAAPKAALARLGECLVAPLAPSPEVVRLVVAGGGVLDEVPWPAVTVGGAFLVERYEVLQVPSALVALGRQPRAAADDAPTSALVVASLAGVGEEDLRQVAAPSGAVPGVVRLAPLGEGWREARAVGAALGEGVELLVDGEAAARLGPGSGWATPDAVLAALGRVRVAHFVAHGTFDRNAPMRSALFLDGRGGRRTLLARDFVGRDLHHLELVSLAACESGRTVAAPGAEAIGFLRALLGSGAGSVLLARWQVDDRATTDLFTELYRRLPAARPSTALRQAQISLRARSRHPYWWAGIGLYGEI
jgi:hypothetical protein